PDRHAAANHLAVGHHVGIDAVISLSSPWMNAESIHHLVKNKCGPGLPRNLSNPKQKLLRLKIRMTALHRLNQHRCQFVRMLLNVLQRLIGSVVEHGYVSQVGAWNSRRRRLRQDLALPLQLLHQNFIELSVVIAREEYDSISARHG